MNTLNLIERDSILRPVTRAGFWQRQFAAQVTKPQIIFDREKPKYQLTLYRRVKGNWYLYRG